jgi:hypothetical protein
MANPPTTPNPPENPTAPPIDSEAAERTDNYAKALEKVNEIETRLKDTSGMTTEEVNKLKDAHKAAREEADKFAFSMLGVDDRMKIAVGSLSAFSTGIEHLTGDIFSKINESVGKYMKDVGDTADFTTTQMTAFGLATTAVLGPLKSFSGESFTGLNTFTGQFERFFDTIAGNDTAVDKLLKTFGVVVPASIKPGTAAFTNFAKKSVEAITQSADSAVKLEDVYLRSAAATGRLGAVTEHTGRDMLGMNEAVSKQRSTISEAVGATNLSTEVIEHYYSELSKLPTAFSKNANAEEKAMGNTSSLTSLVQLSMGTHRDFKDVLGDVNDAIRNYNASMPEAQRFTEQISEVAANTGTEISDVEKALRGASEAFKMFGNEGDGAAAVLNEYVQQLRATGLSGAASTEIVSNMTNQISRLTIAQKAFISAQSGGPGGLMGAFDIDVKLREGKFKEVSDMVRNQLTKMMGSNLVSTEEAARSPAAAAQMTKQIMMLQQGPLGSFAKSPQEAEHIIDALKGGKALDFKELSKGQDGVNDAIKLGNTYAAQTATGMSRSVSLLEEIKAAATGANQNLMQAGSTGARGFQFSGQEDEAITKARSSILGAMEGSAARANAGEPINTKELTKEIERLAKDVPQYVKAEIAGIGHMTGLKVAPKREDEIGANYAKGAEEEKRRAQNIQSASVRKQELDRIDKEAAAVKATLALQAAKRVLESGGVNPETITTSLKPTTGAGTHPGADIHGAAATNAAKGATLLAAANAPGAAHGGKTQVFGTVELTVNVGCPKCGHTFETSEHSVALNPVNDLKSAGSEDHHRPGVM